MRDHELRYVLNDELHGRPGLPVTAPARITHLAFTLREGDADPVSHIKLLCDALGVKPPADGAAHHSADIAGGQIKYERHGEFYRLSVVAEGGPDKGEALALLPVGWVDGLPGARLVGIHTRVMAKDEPAAARLHEKAAELSAKYGGATLDQLAYAWIMAHPSCPLPIIGTNKLDRIQAVVKAADIHLEREDWYALWVAAKGHGIP